MTQLERAVESTGALLLARIVSPVVMTVGIGIGAWIGNAVYDELKLLRADVTAIRIKQGENGVILQEHERRLNRMEMPRANPGVFSSPSYGPPVGGPK